MQKKLKKNQPRALTNFNTTFGLTKEARRLEKP